MAGLTYSSRNEYNTDNAYILRRLSQLNTILVGKVVSLPGENKATVSIYNQYCKTDTFGNTTYTPYPDLTTNFVSASLFQYTPSVNDTVMIFVSQSDISSFLNPSNGEANYPTRFNIFDSIIMPVSLFYSNVNAITAGLASKDFDLSCNNFNASAAQSISLTAATSYTVTSQTASFENSTSFSVTSPMASFTYSAASFIGSTSFLVMAPTITLISTIGTTIATTGFSVVNETANLILNITAALTAIGSVVVDGQTIDMLTGGAVSSNVVLLETFNV